ncbi:MAG: hypothetical protein N4A48_14865 [Tepidibacter sp.]|jgi:hypothetical protein|nr:hypothetical protein [Tepidibacter sp.]MCT4510011.1 hypothetical protein [Tepidibacter sp.]
MEECDYSIIIKILSSVIMKDLIKENEDAVTQAEESKVIVGSNLVK